VAYVAIILITLHQLKLTGSPGNTQLQLKANLYKQTQTVITTGLKLVYTVEVIRILQQTYRRFSVLLALPNFMGVEFRRKKIQLQSVYGT
jgi:hypothetical protein